MKKDKKIKVGKHIIEFDDIQRATRLEPEPPEEFIGTIQNGKRDEIIEKIISETSEE